MPCPATRRETTLSLMLRTGDHCTETGWWTAVGHDSARFVTEGSLMPSFEGHAVLWDTHTTHTCTSCPAQK